MLSWSVLSQCIHTDRVIPEWLDYNGHLNEAWYVHLFGCATDLVLDAVGLDPDSRAVHTVSAFTVEAHIRYLSEAREGDILSIQALVAGVDDKRMRLLHRMTREGDNALLAVSELVLLHVDVSGQARAAPFRQTTRENIEKLALESRPLLLAGELGRCIEKPAPF